MVNRVEKLSLLSEMIAFAKYDKDIMRIEFNFLLGVAKQLDISREDFEYLLENPVTYTHLKSHSERIVQFHRLVLLMNIEQEHNEDNNSAGVIKLYNFGLRMGLSHESITKVLYLMESFPNKIVPPDVLIDIKDSDRLFSFLNTRKKMRKNIKKIFVNLDYNFLNNQIKFNNIKMDNQEFNDQSLVLINGNNFKNRNKNRQILNEIFSIYEG